MELVELNEAFAATTLACLQELGLSSELDACTPLTATTADTTPTCSANGLPQEMDHSSAPDATSAGTNLGAATRVNVNGGAIAQGHPIGVLLQVHLIHQCIVYL